MSHTQKIYIHILKNMLPLEFKPIKPETVLIAVTPSAPPSFAARAIGKEENNQLK